MKNAPLFKIKKRTGEFQDFSRIKFVNSLHKSGLDEASIKKVLAHLLPRFKSGLTTKQLYKLAYQLINKHSYKAASKYAFPKTLISLGPDGFNFENFVASLMVKLGYDVKVGVVLKGKCVTHEVDVIASKNGKTIYMECKFHNSLTFKEDIKTALYVKARWDDLKSNSENKFDEFWLVTNSKFSSDATKFSQCSGLKALSPFYPENGNLYDLVVQAKAHPIGILNSLKIKEKEILIKNGLLFVKDLLSKPALLKKLAVDQTRRDGILKEARTLCSPF